MTRYHNPLGTPVPQYARRVRESESPLLHHDPPAGADVHPPKVGDTCGACHGSGKCAACKGAGYIKADLCPECKGDKRCPMCKAEPNVREAALGNAPMGYTNPLASAAPAQPQPNGATPQDAMSQAAAGDPCDTCRGNGVCPTCGGKGSVAPAREPGNAHRPQEPSGSATPQAAPAAYVNPLGAGQQAR
jgi:RecJ-like exonuclease